MHFSQRETETTICGELVNYPENPRLDEIRGAYMSNDWTSTSRSQFFWASFFFGIFKFIFGLILDFFSILKRNIFKDLHALHTFRLVLLKIEEPLDVV